MSRRTRYFLLIGLLIVAAVGAAVYVAKQAPPRAARLLPEADGIAYVNLQPIRLATHLDQKPVPHSPDYQKFIDSTGIVFERDLDAAAFAIHKMADPNGPNGPAAFSEVFVGKFDGKRLADYLGSIATARETYAGHEIFTIPVGLPATVDAHVAMTSRLLRVTELDRETIAASNAPTTEQIHAILDHQRGSVNPFGGSTLLGGLYPEVPAFSSVWGIGAIGLPFAEEGRVSAFGFHLPLADTTPFVASLRYTTGLHLRIEQIAGTDAEAGRTVQKLTTLLAVVRQMVATQPVGTKADLVAEFTDSLKIEQEKDRAILTAVIPIDLLRKLTSPNGLARR